MADCDVLVCQPTQLDYSIYQLWLKGLGIRESVTSIQYTEFAMGSDPQTLYNYIRHQYRNFEMVDHFLRQPTGEGKTSIFAEQFLFPLPANVRQALIDGYYGLDEAFVKEILGKKLTGATRKGLDEMSEEIALPVVSCRRQFDNMKRIYKVVEDVEGPALELIREHFLLSENLATKYVRILFMTNNKLETYTNKKKFALLKTSDFEYCVSIFLRYWTSSGSNLELDPKFLKDMMDMKGQLLGESFNELHQLALNHFAAPSWEKTLSKVKGHMKTLIRNVFTLGGGLRQDRELRDIFLDLAEKVVSPCKKALLTAEESGEVMMAMGNALKSLKSMHEAERKEWTPVIERYTIGLKLCVERLHAVIPL